MGKYGQAFAQSGRLSEKGLVYLAHHIGTYPTLRQNKVTLCNFPLLT